MIRLPMSFVVSALVLRARLSEGGPRDDIGTYRFPPPPPTATGER